MGCVIAELFLEGKALFDLSKVISAHSSVQSDDTGYLKSAED